MKLSIIVLTYNHENFIEDFLNSAKYQELTYNFQKKHSVQIVLSDDNSSDDTIEVVNRWKKNNQDVFEDFIVIKNSQNIGTCQNYLKALDLCNGDYIKAIGGDDILPEVSVFTIASYLDNYDIVCGMPFVYNESCENSVDEIVRILRKSNCIQKSEEKISYYNRIHRNCFINAPATYISKDLLTDIRIKEVLSTYKYTDDYPQWLKMSEIKNISVVYIPMISVIYRRTEKSAYIIRNRELLEERIRSFKYAIDTCDETVGKLLLNSTLKNMERIKLGKTPQRELIQYLHEYYWLKNRRATSPYTKSLVEHTLEYIEYIKKQRWC